MQGLTLRQRALALTVLLLCFSALVFGQGYQGGLRGRVMDAQGAVIANAKVEITDDATNLKRDTVSNAEGEFVFSAVNPATYTLSAENAGFKKFERKVIIGTQEFITLDVKLEVGAITESVLVSEEVPLMETSNASQGTMLDRQKLVDLPNVGRNPFIMAWITPGVIPSNDPRFVRFQDQSGSSTVSFAGGPIHGNTYLLDGVPITDGTGRAVLIPSIESVEEMKIQTNTYDAELGRFAGGVYNTFLRSGANAIHGSLFGNIRGTWGFANDFFANRAGQPKAPSPYKNFGWSIGGPVVIPHIYNGRNKTFFWLVFEGYRQQTGQFNTLAVPTALEKVGDFSQTHNADGSLRIIYDPLTTVKDSTGAFVSRMPFAGNIITNGRINPVGRAIAALFHDPTEARSYYGQPNDQVSDTLHDGFANEATGKVDHQITNWWRANFSYLHYGSREVGADWWGTPSTPGAWELYRYSDVTTTNQTITPNPTTVISLRYGFNRFPNRQTFIGEGFNITQLGFPASFQNGIQDPGFPVVTMQENTGLGCGGCPFAYNPNSKNFLASVSKFAGKHNIKVGMQFRQMNWPSIGFGSAGTFTFDRNFTSANPSAGVTNSGADLASMLLGVPSSGSDSLQLQSEIRFKYYGYYFHDDFRISPSLTFNIGLRYEFEQMASERNNRLAIGFDHTAVNPIQASLPAGSGVLATGGLMYAGVNGNDTHLGDPSYLRFAPRLGVAWRINDKTTVRGGYGLFWAPPIYGNYASPGYAQTTPYVATADNISPCAGCSLSNPYPNGLLAPVGNLFGAQTNLGQGLDFWNDSLHHGGEVHQYSVDVQRTLPGNFNASIAFAGALSRHLEQNSFDLNVNQLNPAFFSQGQSLLNSVPNPFYGLTGPYSAPPGFFNNPQVSAVQLLLPYPEFTTINQHANGMRALYQSVVFRVEKRFSGGLSVLAHLTVSKTLDMANNGTNFSSGNQGVGVQNAYNYDSEYSLAAQNIPRRFVSVVTYELPFGKGKRFVNGSRLADYVIGGWQLNLITTIAAGFPMSVIQSNNPLNAAAGTAGQRPNATGSDPNVSGSPQDKLNDYLNIAAFSVAPGGTFGNISRTLGARSPAQNNWDLSVFKSVKIKERVTLQFRAESINVTNTPRFNGPGALNVSSGSFAFITGQANFPRFVQLGGRITW